MSDEPGKIEQSVNDAAKGVSLATSVARFVGWCHGWLTGTLPRLHRAIVSDTLSTARRWRLNVTDFAKAHAIVFWQGIGAAALCVAEWIQTYILPTAKAELDSSDWSKVAKVALLAAAARLIVAMVQKGQQAQQQKTEPGKASPEDW